MILLRLAYTAAVMVVVISLLRSGNPVGALLIVPATAVWLRQRLSPDASPRGFVEPSVSNATASQLFGA